MLYGDRFAKTMYTYSGHKNVWTTESHMFECHRIKVSGEGMSGRGTLWRKSFHLHYANHFIHNVKAIFI